MACECCGDRWTSSRFCKFCDKLYLKEEKLRVVKREKKKKIVQPLTEKVCDKCTKKYMPKVFSQKFCSAECRPKPLTEAEKWLNAKPRTPVLNSDQVAYGFFRKKYGISKKYNACRG